MSRFIVADPAFVNNSAFTAYYSPGLGTTGITYRAYIPASAIVNSSNTVSVKFYAHATLAGFKIGMAYIGHSGGASIYYFDGNQKKLTFNKGSDSVDVTAGGVLSDEISFTLEKAKAVVIAIFFSAYPTNPSTIYVPYRAEASHSLCLFSGGNYAAATTGTVAFPTTNSLPMIRLIACTYTVTAKSLSQHTATLLSAQAPMFLSNNLGLPYDPAFSTMRLTNSLAFTSSPMIHTVSLGTGTGIRQTTAFGSHAAFRQTQSPWASVPMFLTQSMNDSISVPMFSTNELSEHNGQISTLMRLSNDLGSYSVGLFSNSLIDRVAVPGFFTNELKLYNEQVSVPFRATNALGSQSSGFFTNEFIGDRIGVPGFFTNEIQEKTLTAVPFRATVAFEDPKPLIPVIPVTQPDGNIEYLNPSQAWDVLLDGKSIKLQNDPMSSAKYRITSCKIEHGEDAPHNRVDLSAVTRDLFHEADPKVNRQQSRIEVRIGDRKMFFLLEERSGNEEDFSFNGRSLSARFDEPFYKDWRYTTESDISAIKLAKQLTDEDAVDWQVLDTIIPKGTEFTGSPIKAIERLAEIQGAIVRCADNGTIVVRKKWAVRPVCMPMVLPEIAFDRTNIDKLDFNFAYGERYTSVEVAGCQGESEESPEIEEETEDSPKEDDIVCDKKQAEKTTQKERKIGDSVKLRVYWGGGKVPSRLRTYATSGRLSFAGSSSTTHKTRVEFKDYKGSVNKPMSSLLGVEWIGASGSGPTWTPNSKELLLDESGPSVAIADVTYTSSFDRYEFSGGTVEQIIAALIYGENGGFEPLTVGFRDIIPAREAPAISDELIRTDPIAIARGTAFLDDVSYDKKTNSIGAAYHPAIIDGAIISLENEHLEIVGNAKITKVSTTINMPDIWQDIEVVQCQPL